MPSGCRFCGTALTALEQMAGPACARAGCRRAASEQRLHAARAADLAARRARAARAWHAPAVGAAAVVWLQPHGTRLVDVSADQRREQVAHLSAIAESAVETASAAAETMQPGAALPGRVCGFCGGRCCRHGAFAHAFVDRALLQRWTDAHPGSTLHEAAAAYAEKLPRRHVEASCLHHGREGCTLPREMRSDICNRHACDALVQAQQHVADGAPGGLVVAMPGAGTVERAAWLSETGARALPRRPRPG